MHSASIPNPPCPYVLVRQHQEGFAAEARTLREREGALEEQRGIRGLRPGRTAEEVKVGRRGIRGGRVPQRFAYCESVLGLGREPRARCGK